MTLPAQWSPIEKMPLGLPGGATVSLPVCRARFRAWDGPAPSADPGAKPVLDHGGEAFFAEAMILRLLQQHGWDGVWVQTNGGVHFVRSIPADRNSASGWVELPAARVDVLRGIWDAARTKACFDLFVWQGERLMFCKARRRGRERLTPAQRKFVDGALACGFAASQLLVVEWDAVP